MILTDSLAGVVGMGAMGSPLEASTATGASPLELEVEPSAADASVVPALSEVPQPPAATPGSYPDLPASCASVVDFVGSDPRRLFSRERDFGLRWRQGSSLYRVAWIEDTGELYIVQLGTPESGGGHIELLAAGAGAADVERWLGEWQDRMDRPDSLGWLRRRVREGIDAGAAKAPTAAICRFRSRRSGSKLGRRHGKAQRRAARSFARQHDRHPVSPLDGLPVASVRP